MTRIPFCSVLAAIAFCIVSNQGLAQGSQPAVTGTVQPPERSFGLFDRIFGNDDQHSAAPSDPRMAQANGAELVMRLDRLEAQIRQLTGIVEQLQYRNQQLEAQVRRSQEDAEYRFQELGSKGGANRPASRPAGPGPTAAPAPAPTGPAAAPGRRGDAFDPAQNPNAPGAPRALGSVPAEQQTPGGAPEIAAEESAAPSAPQTPSGRFAGTPLDLSTLAGPLREQPVVPPGSIDQSAPRSPARPSENPGAQVATLPPADTPRDQYDLAYGYVLRKDYGLAEQSFRAFLKKYPSDRLAPDAQYWLGESLYQRQQFRDAAESFLNVSTKYETAAKAPDALLRLGQSLAGLGEKEAACASLGEVTRKYPRAPLAVKQGVEREQKRVRC